MSVRIHTGDTSADRLLEAARPLFHGPLQMLGQTGDVLFLGENTLEDTSIEDAAAILIFYRQEDWLRSPRHKQLSEACTAYAALPFPVSLAKLEQALSQLCSHYNPADRPGPALVLSDADRTVRLRDAEIRLTDKEFRILEILCETPGQTVPKDTLLREVWPEGTEGNSCEVYLTYLRRKLRPILGDSAIISIRGKGYVLRLP